MRSIHLGHGAACFDVRHPCRRRKQAATVAASSFLEEKNESQGVVVILGATGTGKSKLSIDIGTRYPSEIINSDKMQVYSGLDITTNKMPMVDRKGVPHHLLGELHPADGHLSPTEFRSLASKRINSIRSRGNLPIVAGGSNSFVHALLSERHDFGDDPFVSGGKETTGSENRGRLLRYRCCLLWVDVGWDVLEQYLDNRVDEMMEMGMMEELATHFDRQRAMEKRYQGLEMAIGVPEFDRYFLKYPPEPGGRRRVSGEEKEGFVEMVEEIKKNTRVLARRQLEKIELMREVMGWEIRRLDATEAVRMKVEGRGKWVAEEAWERDVTSPGLEEVERFLLSTGNRGWLWWGTRREEGEVAVGRVRGDARRSRSLAP